MKKLICALLFLAFSNIWAGGFKDGNSLYASMTSKNVHEKEYALGYVIGVADTNSGVLYNLPNSITAGQISDVVEKYLENYPEKRHYLASSLVEDALIKVFPKSPK